MKLLSKSVKRIFCLVLALALLGAAAGCDLSSLGASPKDFTVGDLTITLTDQFEEIDAGDFLAAYASNAAGVSFISEEKSYFGDITLAEYADLVMYAGDKEDAVWEAHGDHLWTSYTDTVDGTEFYYLTVCCEGSDAFWIVNLWALNISKLTIEQDLPKWASSIKIADK